MTEAEAGRQEVQVSADGAPLRARSMEMPVPFGCVMFLSARADNHPQLSGLKLLHVSLTVSDLRDTVGVCVHSRCGLDHTAGLLKPTQLPVMSDGSSDDL